MFHKGTLYHCHTSPDTNIIIIIIIIIIMIMIIIVIITSHVGSEGCDAVNAIFYLPRQIAVITIDVLCHTPIHQTKTIFGVCCCASHPV